MFNITYNGIVTVNRGDSFEIPILINFGTNLEPLLYKVTPNDILYMGIMEPNQPFEAALIRKKCTIEDVDGSGNVVFKFRPQDTQCVLPGKYYYQVKLQRFNSNTPDDYTVDTVIPKKQFFILEWGVILNDL